MKFLKEHSFGIIFVTVLLLVITFLEYGHLWTKTVNIDQETRVMTSDAVSITISWDVDYKFPILLSKDDIVRNMKYTIKNISYQIHDKLETKYDLDTIIENNGLITSLYIDTDFDELKKDGCYVGNINIHSIISIEKKHNNGIDIEKRINTYLNK